MFDFLEDIYTSFTEEDAWMFIPSELAGDIENAEEIVGTEVDG